MADRPAVKAPEEPSRERGVLVSSDAGHPGDPKLAVGVPHASSGVLRNLVFGVGLPCGDGFLVGQI